MKQATHFQVNPTWKTMIIDMGMNPSEVLALAGLPADLFSRKSAYLSTEEYFGLWRSLEISARDQELPLLIGKAINPSSFNPPIFAAFCSPNFNIALERLSQYKPLICPLRLMIKNSSEFTTVELECYQISAEEMPYSIGALEAVYLTQLCRLATRKNITPHEVKLKHLPPRIDAYYDFFGIEITQSDINSITFSQEDALRPFISENHQMWDYFEPELKKRLSNLDIEANISQRVKSSLLEMLPSGESSMEQVASKLAMSKRTLQRRLSEEGENFKTLLQKTREQLAKHYLINSNMSLGEISFLLGFQDSNSFNRAYSSWTGQSPGQFRNSHDDSNRSSLH